MVIILCICLVVAITVALYYRSKAEEFESLYDLSIDSCMDCNKVKLNKDGSIAKKRGRKPKNEQTIR